MDCLRWRIRLGDRGAFRTKFRVRIWTPKSCGINLRALAAIPDENSWHSEFSLGLQWSSGHSYGQPRLRLRYVGPPQGPIQSAGHTLNVIDVNLLAFFDDAFYVAELPALISGI